MAGPCEQLQLRAPALPTWLGGTPPQTDPAPWHRVHPLSCDTLAFPVTHLCPATHSFHPARFPLRSYTQTEFQELSLQLVLIPKPIPSAFWEHSCSLINCRQCCKGAWLRASSSTRRTLGDSLFSGIHKRVVLRAKCVKSRDQKAHQHLNRSLDQEPSNHLI